jgi:hypothetical protein
LPRGRSADQQTVPKRLETLMAHRWHHPILANVKGRGVIGIGWMMPQRDAAPGLIGYRAAVFDPVW